jgi:hypothetical protein
MIGTKKMASTPEVKVKKVVRQVLDGLGAYYVMPVTNGYGNSGAPDFLVCLQGRFIGIECKAGKNKPTALQELNLKKIRDAGGVALVVNETNVVNLNSLLSGERNEDTIGSRKSP